MLDITLSEAAIVSGKACRTVTKCVTFSKAAAAGARTLSVLKGKLKPGRYTITPTATDAARNASKAVTLRLTVTR